MQVDFDREREWWDAKAWKEEKLTGDEPVNKALCRREINRHLEEVRTILDVGGGTGAFSIPLAEAGYAVTHVDYSPAMLERAREKAHGVKSIQFIEGNAADLSAFHKGTFDLVLNLDGAVSFSGSEAERVIRESCRVAKKKVILTVTNRVNMIPAWTEASLTVAKDLLPMVASMAERGEWHQEEFPENAVLAKGLTQDYLGAMKAFLPGELKDILEGEGMNVLRCGGLGSLARFCPEQALRNALDDEELFEKFLDLCEWYDRNILPGGPGTRLRAGLIAVADRI